MKNLREQIVSMSEKFGSRLIGEIGNASIKIGDQSRGACFFLAAYEPKIPLELLKENIED
ncbi:MAG TPA: cyclic lactone autoinducer peptide [Pseudobacteroides sp.]|nr:cyclic lactone autoinducer peptide [Pseudobacteroides sp.]